MDETSHYFLDTSTQIARHWEDEDARRKVHADLSGTKLRCSIYVEREYRCKILNTLIKVHLTVKNSRSLEEAELRLKKLITYRDEALVYTIGKRLFQKYQSQKPLLKYLERLIEVDWQNYFYDNVPKALCDLTGCTRGADAPKCARGYYFTIPTACPDKCKICDFWKEKDADLQELAQMDATDPKGSMPKIRAEAQAVLGGKTPHGDPCRTLSDAVISIEARDAYPGITIHTMDADFEHLKDVLETRVRLFKLHGAT